MLQKQGGDLVTTQEADCFLGPHSPCCVLELDAFGGGWCVLAKAKSLFCIWGETLLELMGSEDQREDNISVSAFLSLLKDHTAENMDSKIVRGLLFWQLRMQEFFFFKHPSFEGKYSHLQLRISFCLECSEEPPEGPLRNPDCLISVIPCAFPTLTKVWKVTKQVLFEKFCSGNLVYSLSRIPPSSFPLHALQELGWKCPSRCVEPPRGRTQQAQQQHLLIVFLQFICIVKMGRRKSMVPTPGISLPLSGIFLWSLESR